jgi:hypothetical protein
VHMVEISPLRVIRDTLVEKIWEGTISVLSLDLARAAQDPATRNSFISVSGVARVL